MLVSVPETSASVIVAATVCAVAAALGRVEGIQINGGDAAGEGGEGGGVRDIGARGGGGGVGHLLEVSGR